MRRYVYACAVFMSLWPAAGLSAASEGGEEAAWSAPVLDQLCRTYAEDWYDRSAQTATGCVEAIGREIGERLVSFGPSGVSSRDLALFALLVSQAGDETTDPALPRPEAVRAVSQPSAGSEATGEEPVPEQLSDIGKGQEGFAQGVERLSALPLSERMVVTGDITSGFQAATVEQGPELTSAFGRARVNFVMRAAPGSDDGRVSEGYFFVQMLAAGGATDTSPVGGPPAFSPLNDVATDRSSFNQGASRGNVYLKKAFYQQEFSLGSQGTVLGRVGVISLSDLFDTSEFANNEARQFLNAAFVNSPAYKGGVGAPGFMLEYRRPVDFGAVEALTVRSGYGITRTFRALTSPLWTNEIEAQVSVRGQRGAYRVGATVGNVPDSGGLGGVHFGFDQWLTSRVGMFARYAQSNRGTGSLALSPVRQSYSLGSQWRLGDDVERMSAFGVGFSQAFPIDSTAFPVSERVIETYFRRQLSANLSLTPDLQLVFGSGGQSELATHVVGGVRISVGF